MSYLLIPDLLAILWMAVVLSHLRSRHANDFLHLWIAGLGLIVVEGVARLLYTLPLPLWLHELTHVIALDGYFLAGVAFFQSATGKLRYLRNSKTYLLCSVLPSLVILTCYGAAITSFGVYLTLGLAGAVLGAGTALVLRRPLIHVVCQAAIWIPALIAIAQHDFRCLTYLLLFDVYLATAIAFSFTLPRERWGRGVVIAGFALWSLCFLTHPWIATRHQSLILLAEKIWDLQKFLVTFGLLIVSLEEDSAAKEYQALHDTLTGLPNRRLFRDRLAQALAHSARKGTRVVLFNIDLDGFKEVNDQWGHDAGDALLQQIGARLGSVTRQSDTLARMGGDEFQLVIHDFAPQFGASMSAAELESCCAQVRENFRFEVERSPMLLPAGTSDVRVQPRLSIGAAIFPDQAETMDDLCRLADQNMYADKRLRSGKARMANRNSALHLTPQSIA